MSVSADARSASPFDQLTAQLQQLQQTGSLSLTQAQALLGLAQQLQFRPGRAPHSRSHEDRSSVIAVANEGRRRREVRWDASAAPRLRSSVRGSAPPASEEADDNDAASAAAQAPSEYAHGARGGPGDRDDEEDVDADEEGADFDTAEVPAGAPGRGPVMRSGGLLLSQAAPSRDEQRDTGGGDNAAADLPGPPRYALPGDDMDAAGE